MATIANSVMLIGIVNSIDIEIDLVQTRGFVTFSLTTNESIRQSDGTFAIETNVFNCFAQQPLASKIIKEDLAGRKVACQGRLISSRDSSEQESDENWVFIQVEDIFKVER